MILKTKKLNSAKLVDAMLPVAGKTWTFYVSVHCRDIYGMGRRRMPEIR